MWKKQDEDECSSIDGLPYEILDWAVYSELYRKLLSLVNVEKLDNSIIYSQLQELLAVTLQLNEEKFKTFAENLFVEQPEVSISDLELDMKSHIVYAKEIQKWSINSISTNFKINKDQVSKTI